MTAREAGGRQIRVRLVHDGVQPGPKLDEPMRFGLQDRVGEVHPGLERSGAMRNFDLTLDIRGHDSGPPAFAGPFVQGPPSARFLYLSWKRVGQHEHPWCWRIKIPLVSIAWPLIAAAEKPGMGLVADVTGRRPHTSEPVAWKVERIET